MYSHSVWDIIFISVKFKVTIALENIFLTYVSSKPFWNPDSSLVRKIKCAVMNKDKIRLKSNFKMYDN